MRYGIQSGAFEIPHALGQALMVQVRTLRLSHVLLITGASALIVLLAYEAPLTFDEAFNRVAYDNLSVIGIMVTYSWPNNHIPFTLLQSFIPGRLLAWNPWTIRIFGVASSVAMVTILTGAAAARRATPLFGLFIVLGSPLLVTYLFVSRGYTFSAVFLVAAAALPVLLARRDSVMAVCLGAAALAFATWPLPTNAFIAPGWIVGVLAICGLRAAIAGTAVYTGAVAVLFAPIAGQVYTQAGVWNLHESWWQWLGDLTAASSLVPVCLGLVVAVTIASIARRHRSLSVADVRARGGSARLALLTATMSVSWFGLIGVAHAVVGLHLPFVRTAVPALWLAAVALVAAFPRGRLGYLAVALLVPAFVASVLMWTNAVRNGNWERVSQTSRNDVLYSTTPVTIRDLRSIGADKIDCVGYDAPICVLVTPFLAHEGISVITGTGKAVYDASLPCALGSRRPPVPWEVNVYRQGKLLGVLCH